jgi:hypothetical protein
MRKRVILGIIKVSTISIEGILNYLCLAIYFNSWVQEV